MVGWKKTIDRTDYYMSPVLDTLKLVNASQSFVAEIAYIYAKNNDIRKASIELFEFNSKVSNNSFGLISKNVYENVSLQGLGEKLSHDYQYAGKNDKVLSIHLFRINYANCILKNKFICSKIIEIAGLDSAYSTELRKGVKIYEELIKTEEQINLSLEEKGRMISCNQGFNKIYYGILGYGKSYKIKAMLKHYDGFRDEVKMNAIENSVDDNNIINTTFYLDYTYSDFVGQIYPKVTDKDISYEFVPGPFTKALLKAYTTDKMVYLVIDEINRGNAAAIFGDLFQLLDRLEEDDDYTNKCAGDSVYSISN